MAGHLAMTSPPPTPMQFGNHVLDPVNASLCSGDTEIKLRPRSFEVLLYLARNAGRLVTKDELLASVWPGLIVTDNSLVQCVTEIRQALQDNTHEVIRNVPRRGYIFTQDVTNAEVAAPPAQAAAHPDQRSSTPDADLPSDRLTVHPTSDPAAYSPGAQHFPRLGMPLLLPLVSLIVVAVPAVWYFSGQVGDEPNRTAANPAASTGAVAPRLSIVVLPFKNTSGKPDEDYLADGLTDDLTSDLSRIPDSFVIARNSAFSYKDKAVDVRRVGQELGVRYVLSGTVRRVGSELRVNAYLADAQTGEQLWTERFDSAGGDLPALQRQITGRIAHALHLELIEVEASRVLREAPASPDAYDLVLRGNVLLNRQSREAVAAARNYFQQATALDSQSVAAWAGVARTYFADLDGDWVNARRAWLRQARAATDRAAAINPNYADVNLLHGAALFLDGRMEEALVAFERQLSLTRNYAPAYLWIARAQIALGRPAESLAPMQEAIRLSPRDPQLHQYYATLAAAQLHLGNDETAIMWAEKAIALRPDWIDAYPLLVAAATLGGQTNKAQSALAEYRRQLPEYTIAILRAEELSDRPAYLEQRKRYYAGLRKAGLPE